MIMLLKVICLQYSHSNTAWKTFVSGSEAAPGSSHISDNLPAFAKAVQQEELKQGGTAGISQLLPQRLLKKAPPSLSVYYMFQEISLRGVPKQSEMKEHHYLAMK